MKKNNRGFIAITTAIILSVVILIIALSLGQSLLISRGNKLDFYLKQSTHFLANSCLDKALLELSKNKSYEGNATTTLASGQECGIFPIETSGSNKIIKARAEINGIATNLKLTVVTATLSTISLEEVSGF